MRKSSTRSESLKKHCASPEVKAARSKSQKTAWSNADERRAKLKESAMAQGKDPKILEKRKASFAALPIEECNVCGLKAKKHAMTRHKAKCGSTCAVPKCSEVHHMKGWCLHHFKLSQYAKAHRITPEEMFSIFKRANGQCEICKKSLGLHGTKTRNSRNTACIDHCHTTGKVRGILCFNCNSGLGHLSDDVNTLKIAIKYLQR